MEAETRNMTSEASEWSYAIGSAVYRMVEKLGFQQCKWLGSSVMKCIELHRFDQAQLHDAIRTQGPLAMAICCLRDDETRAQHARLNWSDIATRADEFAAELSPDEVLAFELPFYLRLTPAAVAMMIEGQHLRAIYNEIVSTDRQSPAHLLNGSSTASSRSATETSPSSASSSPSGDRPSLSPISSGASSGTSSTEPSWVGSVSSCPG